MCGITGIYNRDGRAVSLDLVVDMTRKLVHRGPDEEGYFINTVLPVSVSDSYPSLRQLPKSAFPEVGLPKSNVGLGHRRLSIIDLATGQQPLCNEDGHVWIVFNGEIYNYLSIMSELQAKGHRFRTRSDTETIVHAYEEWGEKVVDRLRGMFAFAIWDEKKQQLFLARDRLGKKPLYYWEYDHRFIFGSEIKAILEAPELMLDLDMTALSDYLSLLYIPSPKTIFRYIHKLPAGHYARVTRDAVKIHKYWDLSFYPEHDLSEGQMMEDILTLLDEATRIRLISEVPLGAFLSGGVDSSAVVAMMAGTSRKSVITNSISFNESRYNEAQYAKSIAELFSTDHHEFQVTPEAIPIIEKLAWHYDEPFADSSAVPTYYVSKTARENVTVSLSGDGGDENFAGYSRYYFDVRENRVRNLLPKPIQQPVFGFLSSLYPKTDDLPRIFKGRAFMANLARDPVDAYYFSVSAIHDEYKKNYLCPDVFQSLTGYKTVDFFRDIYANAPANDHLSKIQYLDIKTYLCEDILTKVDRASMAVSLEVRCPLLDHVFMEYVARIPSRKKLVGTNGKYIFKKALKKCIPQNLLYREKMGFAVPIYEWLKKDIKEYARVLVIDGKASKAYLNGDNLERIWKEHQAGTRNWSTQLWVVMMLNLWYERFVG